MATQSEPTFGNGKICYLEIPAMDTQQSASFYKTVFGWDLRQDNYGNVAFNDGVNQISGMWVEGRTPDPEPGIIISIMVDNMEASVKLVQEYGGQIVREPDLSAQEIVSHFTDPAGNLFGLYQHRG
jgi:predicted enzyme related to lactoylglutathione lyase